MKRFGTVLTAVLAIIVATMVATPTPSYAHSHTLPVTNIEVDQEGHNPGEVTVSWAAVAQVTHYRIGYVNMETDYPLAVASVVGEWSEAFVYVDVDARNFTVSGGRVEYTLRRLEQGVRHAFTVRTGNNIDGAFTWPSNPRWRFTDVADQGGACPSIAPTTVAPTSCVADGTCLPIREIGRVSGTGDSTEHVFDLQAGLYRFTLTGDFLVSADLVATTAGRDIFYFDYVGRDEQSAQALVTVDADDAGTFVLEIDAGSDSWQFDIVRIGG